MSVVAEFTVSSEQFVLGQVLARNPEMYVEVERVVPATERVFPYIWVTGDDFEEFERTVEESPHVDSIVALDRLDGSSLYKIEWNDEVESLIHGMVRAGATILEAYGNEVWTFRIRFEDHSGLTGFHNYCMDHDIVFTLDRVYTMAERREEGRVYDLTEPQREALVKAVEWGYFEVPRQVTLEDLAAELGVSEQAISERVRRGTDKVLKAALLQASTNDS